MIITLDQVKSLSSPLSSGAFDSKIKTLIPIVEDFVCQYCNNDFFIYEQNRKFLAYQYLYDVVFDESTHTITIGDDLTTLELSDNTDIYIDNTMYNDRHYNIDSFLNNVITLDDDYYNVKDETISRTSRLDTYCAIFVVKYPISIILPVSKMIEWQIIKKPQGTKNPVSDTNRDYNPSTIDQAYPKEILSMLNEWRYARLR